jgi:hypothetical protein
MTERDLVCLLAVGTHFSLRSQAILQEAEMLTEPFFFDEIQAAEQQGMGRLPPTNSISSTVMQPSQVGLASRWCGMPSTTGTGPGTSASPSTRTGS